MTPKQFRERFMPPHTTVKGPRPYSVAFIAYGASCTVSVEVERTGFLFVRYEALARCVRDGAFAEYRDALRLENRSHANMVEALDLAARLLMGFPAIAAGIQEEELAAAAGPGLPGGRGGL